MQISPAGAGAFSSDINITRGPFSWGPPSISTDINLQNLQKAGLEQALLYKKVSGTKSCVYQRITKSIKINIKVLAMDGCKVYPAGCNVKCPKATAYRHVYFISIKRY